MVDIIDAPGLASYLRDPALEDDESLAQIVELTNGIIAEFLSLDESQPYDPPARVRAVAYEVAARAYRNPEGYASEQIDDYKYSRPAATRAAGVYLTDDEETRLLQADGTPRAKVGWLA